MKKIFFYPFLVLFAILVFFSFGEKVFAYTTCFGLQISEENRCGQASTELITAMRNLADAANTAGIYPDVVVTSIGDNPANFSGCLTGWQDASCNHQRNSCHYGGEIDITTNTRNCTNSYAIDINTNNLSATTKTAILTAANQAGFSAFLENPNDVGGPEHIHASVSGANDRCKCHEVFDGSGTGLIKNLNYQRKNVCIDFNTPIPGIQDFLTEKCPYDNTKYLVSSKTVGLYINAVYKYGAGLAGVVAMFMIVFAAWQWIIAAGNAGKISNAKDTIIGALIGLALLFGGYLLLAQISSGLVELGDLKVKHFDPEYSGTDLITVLSECKDGAQSIPCGTIFPSSSGLNCVGQTCDVGKFCVGLSTEANTGPKACQLLQDDFATAGIAGCGCSDSLSENPAADPTLFCQMNGIRDCSDYDDVNNCNNNTCIATFYNQGNFCLWDSANDRCEVYHDINCTSDNQCGSLINPRNSDVVDMCCDFDLWANNCEFPVDYRLAHPEQFGETNSPQADNCGD